MTGSPPAHRRPARLEERRLGSMPWLAVSGSRTACFLALGEHSGAEIREIVATLPELAAIRRYVVAPRGRERFAAVLGATSARFALHLEEAAAMARGAGVDPETLFLLNLRGELGHEDGADCSDLLVPGTHWVLGHNEDGDRHFAGALSALTLQVDEEQPVFSLWYPGMLGSNAFSLNAGLAWGVDHVPSEAHVGGPARHVVARALQKESDLDAAARFLADTPSAACFAYNMVDRRTGRVATVETGGGAWGTSGSDGASVLWHTNHLRYAPSARAQDCARGAVLEAVARGRDGTALDAPRVTELLTTPLPLGVRADGETATLCTVVCDGASGETTLVARGATPVRVPTDALLA